MTAIRFSGRIAGHYRDWFPICHKPKTHLGYARGPTAPPTAVGRRPVDHFKIASYADPTIGDHRSRALGGVAAIFDDVGRVGGQVGGEVVAARPTRTPPEKKKVRVGRVQDRGYGSGSWVGDRSGRQPRMLIGVVRVAAGQVGFMNGAAIVAGQQG